MLSGFGEGYVGETVTQRQKSGQVVLRKRGRGAGQKRLHVFNSQNVSVSVGSHPHNQSEAMKNLLVHSVFVVTLLSQGPKSRWMVNTVWDVHKTCVL